MEGKKLTYAGFWPRAGAQIIDGILIMAVTSPLLVMIYGREYWESLDRVTGSADLLMSWIFPVVAVIVFWQVRQATPGKMAIGAKIVDARSGEKPTLTQFIVRYFAYYVSIVTFMLGIIWVAFDRRKQGLHDKLARTVVVRRAD